MWTGPPPAKSSEGSWEHSQQGLSRGGASDSVTYVEQPPVGVPRPARDGAVHNRRPEEAKHNRRHDAAALKGAAHQDLHGARAEQQLVEAEQDVGEVGAADRRARHDAAQQKVAQVADEGARRLGVGQRVAPEHPLDRDRGRHHEALEEQRQRRLAPRQAAVEEADARDDEPHEARAKGNVHGVVLEPGKGRVDVHLERVSAPGVVGVDGGLGRQRVLVDVHVCRDGGLGGGATYSLGLSVLAGGQHARDGRHVDGQQECRRSSRTLRLHAEMTKRGFQGAGAPCPYVRELPSSSPGTSPPSHLSYQSAHPQSG